MKIRLWNRITRKFSYYKFGKNHFENQQYLYYSKISSLELEKKPLRHDVINFLSLICNANRYLEIGVRNPEDNFDRIEISEKYSVDPGLEFKLNPVDYKMTSDEFFELKKKNELNISSDLKFDIVFIDGLHEANQVEKDIKNALECLNPKGFIVLHDCNPPTEFHARTDYKYYLTPAKGAWNGSTWKAFVKYRKQYNSCCIDSDFGVGILSQGNYSSFNLLNSHHNIEYFDYSLLDQNRKEILNLISFEELKIIM